MNKKFNELNLLFFPVIISLLLVASTASAEAQEVAEKNPELEVHFIDVDTGDAILIKVLVDGQDRWLLIDGGFDGYGKNRILPYLKEKGVKELDYVIATHYDGDHIGGLDEIFSEVTVKNLYGRQGPPIIEKDSQDYTIFETYRASVETFVQTGEQKPASIDLGSAHFELLADGERPDGVTDQEDGEDVRSIVYLLTFNNKFNILLGGDCHSQCEEAILSKLNEVVLYKVHWHGKNVDGKASSQTLLEKIRPEISVISEGDHSGRPHEPVLDRLRNMNSKICRTDLQDNIIFSITGDAWSIKTKFNEKCPDVFTVDASSKANWQPESDSKIWVKIRDAGELVNDNTQIIAVGHDQRVLESELARYQIRANVKTTDEPYLLHIVDRLVGAKFDLIVDFNGDNVLNGNDFRERSPFEEGKANEEWSSFQIVHRIAQVEQEQSPKASSDDTVIANNSRFNQLVGISIGLSVAAIIIAIVAIVRKRK